MKVSELVRDHPSLYHMAEDGSWPSIQKHGLLCTSELLTLYGYAGPIREKIEAEWRPTKVQIRCEGRPPAVVRDQLVMPREELLLCLPGDLPPSDWYRLVNGRVFFWTTHRDLEGFLSANSYRNQPQTVIEADTRAVVNRFENRITLTPFNTGSTLWDRDRFPRPRFRSRETFTPIAKYSLPYVKELVILGSVRPLDGLVISVKRCISRGSSWRDAKYAELETLWESS